MDFGVLSLDGGGLSSTFVSSEAAEAKQKWTGSEEEWRDFKVGKFADDLSASKGRSSLLRSQEQMLSFSSPNSQTPIFPFYTPFSCSRTSGNGNGGLSTGVRGPFTPSQWMELEHQALIYKYIDSNVPIPTYLLNPIRKALHSAALSSFQGFRSSALGWGGFHLGFSNNGDPEPGRCRRTDGKKWRCSRDAVPDHKYCERHMNRGRHRSRKPVEGQPGHTASRTTTAPTAVVPAGGATNSLGLLNHQPSASSTPSSLCQQNRNYGIPEYPNDQGTKLQVPVRQFMDDCPKNQAGTSAVAWPNIDHSDGTQLSLRLLPELEATKMGMGNQSQGNLIPISWESSICDGPLGEVLHGTNNGNAERNNSSTTTPALDLMVQGWDSSSPGTASSPTGVLQKAAFASLSNSSAGSSPRHEQQNRTHEGFSLCHGLLG